MKSIKNTSHFIVFPEHCNNHKELIFGGAFMAEMDKTAANCSRLLLRANPYKAFGSVTHKCSFVFHMPSYVGDHLEIETEAVVTGVKSITITVKTYRLDPYSNAHRDFIAEGELVFITIDEPKLLEKHPKFLPYIEHGIRE